MYYNTQNSIEIRNFRKARPNIAFPKNPTEEQLNKQGIYSVVEIKDDYTKYQELIEHPVELIDGVYTKRYEAVYKSIDECKSIKLQEIKSAFATSSRKPRVNTGLGFYVDGGRTNKDDFKEEWEDMADDATTTVKDADNKFHYDITKDQMYQIYKAIVTNGKALYAKKWSLEAQVESAENIEEVEAIKW